MPVPQYHHEHLTESLRREIGWTIANRVRDPRVPSVVTVTDISLSPDTRSASVYVSIYGSDKEKEDALVALNRAAAFIQNTVSKRISVKHFPKLSFRADESLERGTRISGILKDIEDDLV
jgi:ribosome-binding factor A